MNPTPSPLTPKLVQARFPDAIPPSIVVDAGAALWLERHGAERRLALLAPTADPTLDGFEGQAEPFDADHVLKRGPLSPANARALRQRLAWLAPRPLGLATSAGCGDRLGFATPGHARALFQVLGERPGAVLLPIFAQQSIREMGRTGRTPQNVLDDATFGTLEAGWHGGVGADADHLKTTDDIDACVAAGFSFFTIDPGAYVDNAADTDQADVLRRKAEALPWADLESSPADMARRYHDQQVDLEDRRVTLDPETVHRAAVKYGAAIAHVARLARHLDGAGVPYDLEVSVDETDTPTTHAEHIYFVSELRRLGVRWVSLAPRCVGRFEKGVDYIGDLDALAADLQGHAAIARACGPYKLSLHSGSDKYSVYPLITQATGGVVHLKTAGTSYVEGLRVIAAADPALYRAIGALGREQYPRDRASYHVSAEVERMPDLDSVADADLPGLLDQFDAREIFHVTYGAALAAYGDAIKATLRANLDAYYSVLQRHFVRHLAPFAEVGRGMRPEGRGMRGEA